MNRQDSQNNTLKKINALIAVTFILSLFSFSIHYTIQNQEPPDITGRVIERRLTLDNTIIQEVENEGIARVIVTLDDRRNIPQVAVSRMNENAKRRLSSSNSFVLEVTKEELEKLRSDMNVKTIVYDYPIMPMLSDTIPLLEADLVWEEGVLGEGQAVCVIDTGVDYTHPDFGGCTTEQFLNNECLKVIDGYDVADDNNNPMDVHGHGTHVAGIVAANGGRIGVSPNVQIIAIKVFTDAGSGSTSSVIAGIEKCTELAQEYNIAAMTLSIGLTEGENNPILRDSYCDFEFTSLSSAINEAVDAGILVAVSAGNSGSTTHIGVPACIEKATPVSSSTKSDGMSPYDRNHLVNVTAPGTSISSTINGGGYQTKSGTSMAAPHVAGAAALLKQFIELQSESITPKQIENALYKTGVQIDDTSNSGKNYSRISLYDAIIYLDLTPPNVSINTNRGDSFQYSEGITINWSSTDNLGIQETSFKIENPLGNTIYQSTNINGTVELIQNNLTFPGLYNISLQAIDLNNNIALVSSTFNVTDVPLPNITLILDGKENNIFLNDSGVVNITGNIINGEKNLELFINGVLESVGNPNISIYYNFTTPGEYNITLRHNESDSLYELNITREVLVYNITPHILNWTPEDLELNISRGNTTIFNQSSHDEQGLSLNYSWILNNDVISTNPILEFDGDSYSLGTKNLTFIVDNSLSTNRIEWNITIQTLPINITISSPQNTSYNQTSINLEYTDNSNLDTDKCWYRLSEINISLEDCNSATLNLTDGIYNLELFINNTLGEVFSSQVNFTIDTIAPFINTAPIPNETILSRLQEFDISVSSGISGLEQFSYEFSGNTINSNPGTIKPFENLTETEEVSIRFIARDNAGNINKTSFYNYVIDITPPSISLNTGIPEKINQTIELDFTIQELVSNFIRSASYRINNRELIVINESINNSEISFTLNLTLPTGLSTLTVFADDYYNNTAIHTTEISSSGNINLTREKEEIEDSFGVQSTFKDNNTEIDGVIDTELKDEIDIVLRRDKANITFVESIPTRIRWEDKSLRIEEVDNSLRDIIENFADSVNESLFVINQSNFFGDNSFSYIVTRFNLSIEDYDFIYYLPNKLNISQISIIEQCPDNSYTQESILPCYTNKTNTTKVFLDSFSGIIFGEDKKTPEVIINFTNALDWRFTPQIIVSGDVFETQNVAMNYSGNLETAISLQEYNLTHNLAIFSEKEEEHNSNINISFIVSDASGNINDTTSIQVTINDTEPPIIISTSPAHGSNVSTDTITLQITLNKRGSVDIDEVNLYNCFINVSQGSCSVPLREGTNIIGLDVYNLAGISRSEQITIIREEEELLDTLSDDDGPLDIIDDEDEGEEDEETIITMEEAIDSEAKQDDSEETLSEAESLEEKINNMIMMGIYIIGSLIVIGIILTIIGIVLKNKKPDYKTIHNKIDLDSTPKIKIIYKTKKGAKPKKKTTKSKSRKSSKK